jgi:quercetin dioxygenase-like cupin family protein
MLAGTEGRTLVRAEIGHEENDYGRSRGRVVVARTHDEEEEEMSSEHTTTTSSADALTSRLTRTVLQQAPSSIPGREIVQVLTEIPVGVESGWHTHPGEEVGYILTGNVSMQIRDRTTLTAGQRLRRVEGEARSVAEHAGADTVTTTLDAVRSIFDQA